MTAKQYRKKPVVIEAARLTSDVLAASEIAKWCGGTIANYRCEDEHGEPGDWFDGVDIVTLEGTMRANLGDYIIRGVQGEFYPCKPDIFAATYERAEAGTAPRVEPPTLLDDLASAINRHSRENASNTPDHVLADYLIDCLLAFESAVGAREKWHGR